jgi:hypothetical protein
MLTHMRLASPEDASRIAQLVLRTDDKTRRTGKRSHHLPPMAEERLTALIRRDTATPNGQSHWWIAETPSGLTAATAHIAVIPPPPIYDLGGRAAGIVLGHWSAPGITPEALISALEGHLRERRAAMLVIACRSDEDTTIAAAIAAGYQATTDFKVKTALSPEAPPQFIRMATEHDVPNLVAFNREVRDLLREANPDFWRSHPEAETRFGLWMKFSLTMRDRTIFVSHEDHSTTGFIIAQPASPIPLSIASEESVGVIDDFHCTTFGSSLTARADTRAGDALVAAAETDFVRRGKTAAMAVCPVAWTSKAALLERAGYRTQFTWYTKPA